WKPRRTTEVEKQPKLNARGGRRLLGDRRCKHYKFARCRVNLAAGRAALRNLPLGWGAGGPKGGRWARPVPEQAMGERARRGLRVPPPPDPVLTGPPGNTSLATGGPNCYRTESGSTGRR